MRTAGQMPGLRLFEGEEDDIQPGLWGRVSSVFTALPQEFDQDVLDPEGFEDLSGSGWVGEDTGLEAEDIEDMAEVLAIVGIGALVVGLLWLRGRWSAWAEERRRRDGEGNGQADARRVVLVDPGIVAGPGIAVDPPGLPGAGRAADVVPEPLIGAPIP